MFSNNNPFNKFSEELYNQMCIIREKNDMILHYLYRCGEDCCLFDVFGLQQVLAFNNGIKNLKLRESLDKHGFLNDNTVLIFPLDEGRINILEDIIFSTEGIR